MSVSNGTKYRLRELNDKMLHPERPEMTRKEILTLYKDALLFEFYVYQERKYHAKRRSVGKKVHTQLAVYNLRKDLEEL